MVLGTGGCWRSQQRAQTLQSPLYTARNVGLWVASCRKRWRRRSRWSSRPRFLQNEPQRTPGRKEEGSQVLELPCRPNYPSWTPPKLAGPVLTAETNDEVGKQKDDNKVGEGIRNQVFRVCNLVITWKTDTLCQTGRRYCMLSVGLFFKTETMESKNKDLHFSMRITD